ncbi:hypothetical protein [Helicobacter didelphidarum]|uniref:hypothetical protein n=1 Tax=Helicobacter didelphidarum TaxID=2040648 RepID=UPI001FE34580|nr:hypothetical protein [Helicobacter didelphidarum]
MIKYLIITLILLLNLYGIDELKSAHKNCEISCDKCGFYITQSSHYFEEIKKQNEEDYFVMMDDFTNYLYSTKLYLQKNSIDSAFKSLSINECPILQFGNFSLEISNIQSPYIFIIYQKDKTPEILQDIGMPEEQINKYFNLKNPKIPK